MDPVEWTAAAGATSLTITKPTTLVNTDVLVAAISFSGGTANNVTAPAGWAQIDRTDTPTASNMSMITLLQGDHEHGG